MPTYAIGDIQGCYQTFRKLLNTIQFNPLNDQLLLAGDMINRGPDSLATMMYIIEHQSNIQCVLGNHDLHFLAYASQGRILSTKDTFNDILHSNEKENIIRWLSRQPLAIYKKPFDTLITHAGLPFNWSLNQVLEYSKDVCKMLQSPNAGQFYQAMYGDQPDQWSPHLSTFDRLRLITNALTRMRYCYRDGRLELTTKSPPPAANKDLAPWFELDNPQYTGQILFGHWASLQGDCPKSHIVALDTGCVWGGTLTAFRLDDKQFFRVNSVDFQR